MVNLYSQFAESAEKHADRVCVTYDDQDLSFEAIHAASKRLGKKLLELAPGDSESDINIGLFAPNVPGFMIGFYGALAANKVTVPINFLLQPNEIMTIGMHAGLRIIIAAGPLYDKLREMTGALPITVLRAEDFFNEEPVPELPAVDRGDEDTAILMYTSGTTGTPKGVTLSHTNVCENWKDTVPVYNLHEGQTYVGVLPLFHCFGMLAKMIIPNMLGARMALLPQFNPQKLAEIFNKYPQCLFFGVAPMFQVLAIMAKTKGVKYANLELCVTGAAALPTDIKDFFESATGIELFQGYGLSEASPVVSLNRPGEHKPGTVGPPIFNVTIQIWDDQDNVLPVGEIGEIMVSGKNVMKGYYKNPEATAKTISPEGWLHTGDLGFLDEDGYTTIVGRKKELIICAGENIYPLEIEDVLMSHPAVGEVAVIGIPHRSKGEEPKAFVALLPDQTVEVSELRDLCREKLAGFKVPAEFEIRDELPKNATGKVLKRVLEEEIKGQG